MKTPVRRHWRRFGIFIINFEHISQLVLVFLLLTLSRLITYWEPINLLHCYCYHGLGFWWVMTFP